MVFSCFDSYRLPPLSLIPLAHDSAPLLALLLVLIRQGASLRSAGKAFTGWVAILF